ncbi:MAG: site-specific DNA-methyltransferase [Gammaproteobacteria bacterium]|nr:site-specific DNA-methyltransferase [Gammaproteobacteria bacterium]
MKTGKSSKNIFHSVIFISIDDNEVVQLRLLMDEIFGEENFIDCVIWNRKRGRDNSAKWFSKSHEYLLVYAKAKNKTR